MLPRPLTARSRTLKPWLTTFSSQGLLFYTVCTTYNSGGYSGTLTGGTAYVYSGSAPVSKTGSATLITIDPGDPASNLPDIYNYNYNGYIGAIPALAAAYVYSGTGAGTKYCTGTWGGTFHVVDGNLDSSDPLVPNSISYNDVDGYSGDIDFIDVNASYQANYNAFLDAVFNSTSWSGYILFDYGSDLSKSDTRIWKRNYSGTVWTPDTRVWRKDYSGTVYGATINYYAYTVTLDYVN